MREPFALYRTDLTFVLPWYLHESHIYWYNVVASVMFIQIRGHICRAVLFDYFSSRLVVDYRVD